MARINIGTAITLGVVGLVVLLVCIPLWRGRIERNSAYGFRFRQAFESDEHWLRINRFGAGAMMLWSLALMALGLVCLRLPPGHVLGVAKAGFASALVPILATYLYARRL